MFSIEKLITAPYKPRTDREATPTIYRKRLHACQSCEMRSLNRCKAAQRIITDLARNGKSCKLGRWPGETPIEQPQRPYSAPKSSPEIWPTTWHPQTLTVAVVIISHNYGRFVREAIESVLRQSRRPDDVIVIDDASEDDTAKIAMSYADRGVKYLRTENRNIHANRAEGLTHTSADVICYLDADNMLSPDYIATGLGEFTEHTVGVVYADLHRFGDRQETTDFPAFDRHTLSKLNYIDAGALIRRTALDLSDIFCKSIGPRVVSDDWFLFQDLAARGWQFRKQSAHLLYRHHAEMCSEVHRRKYDAPHYFTTAGLAQQDLTLFIPLAGRLEIWQQQMASFLARQKWPHDQTRLILCDTSQNAEFTREVKQWIAECDYTDVRHIQMRVGTPGLSDQDRRQGMTEREVQLACCRIYNRLARAVETDYVWILEDDVIPPDDAAERLLKNFTPEVGTVSAPYESRYDPDYVAWGVDGSRLKKPTAACVESIRGSGFGCVVMRAGLLRDNQIQIAPRGRWYDPSFFDLLPPNVVRLIDWSCEAKHIGPRFYDQHKYRG